MPPNGGTCFKFIELLIRLELTTSSLPRKCSTTELQQHYFHTPLKECTKVHKIFENANFFALFLSFGTHIHLCSKLCAGLQRLRNYLIRYIKLSSCAMSWRCICSGEKSAKTMVIICFRSAS